mmetsp:Transcript_137219/g.382768  ORF Transcript_137219/g.382768 Transcript_137219/m.382768 type:complete len:345 (-) Transcript_137219:67-1101(-)
MASSSGGASGADGLVAFGGVLDAAISAYRANEDARVEEVRCLRRDLEEGREREAELQKQVEALKSYIDSEIEKLRQLPMLQFELRDVAGVWFATNSLARVTVSPGGRCTYDSGAVQQIRVVDGKLMLADAYTLSLTKSSRKQLVWDGETPPLIWTREMPCGSHQVTLKLDVTGVVTGSSQRSSQYPRTPSQQQIFTYGFSLMTGCDVALLLCRNKKGEDGRMVEGEQFVGVHFGLREKKPRQYGEPSPLANSIDAITCTSRVEIWDVAGNAWVQATRSSTQRLEAGGPSCGEPEALSFGRFKQIIGPPSEFYNRTKYVATFRVTITDVGVFELSRVSETPLVPE